MAVNSARQLSIAFRKAASDGKVTDAESRNLISQAARNALTRAETRVLANQLALHKDQFEAPAAIRLQRFVAAAQKPADTADPRVMRHDVGELRYKNATGGLYKNGVALRDVVQGHAGDCYLVSTLAAAAKQRPALISNAITRKEDGSFIVRFYQRGADGLPAPVYVAVDKELPRDRWGSSHYAHGTANKELWVSVVEKAYAKWKGSYEKIGNGGNPAEVMEALTGKMGNWSQTADVAPGAVYDKLKTQLAHKGLAVAATRTGPQYKGSGVVPSHAYTVLGVEDAGGQMRVRLRNPWGATEPGAPRAGDGVFTLSLSKFIKLFPDLFMSA
jgi:hypothetical protein